MTNQSADGIERCDKCDNHAIGVFDYGLLYQMHTPTRSLQTDTDGVDS